MPTSHRQHPLPVPVGVTGVGFTVGGVDFVAVDFVDVVPTPFHCFCIPFNLSVLDVGLGEDTGGVGGDGRATLGE